MCDPDNEAAVEEPTRCLFGWASPRDRAARLEYKGVRKVLVKNVFRSALDWNQGRSLQKSFSITSSCIPQMPCKDLSISHGP